MRKGWSRLGLAAVAFAAALYSAGGYAELAKLDRLLSQEEAQALAGERLTGSASGQYLAGRLAQNEQDYGKAADYLEGALSWDPNNIQLRRWVFLLMLAEGRLPEALPHAYPLERDSVEPMLPVVAQAAAVMKDGDYAAALQQFGRLDSTGVAGLIRMLGQAWAALGMDDLGVARAVLAFEADQPHWGNLIAIHRVLIEDVGGGEAAAAYTALADSNQVKSPRAAEILQNFRARQADPTVKPLVATVEDGLGEAFFSIAVALSQSDRDL